MTKRETLLCLTGWGLLTACPAGLPPLADADTQGPPDVLAFVDAGGQQGDKRPPDSGPADLDVDRGAADGSAADVTAESVAGEDLCVPTTCNTQSNRCGALPDGCGGALQCGPCVVPLECGGGGQPNVCGQGMCFVQITAPVPGVVISAAQDWQFGVTPVWGALRYLWGFFQGGQLVLEELTTGPQLLIPAATPARAAVAPGRVDLWVRAGYPAQWTCAGKVFFSTE